MGFGWIYLIIVAIICIVIGIFYDKIDGDTWPLIIFGVLLWPAVVALTAIAIPIAILFGIGVGIKELWRYIKIKTK